MFFNSARTSFVIFGAMIAISFSALGTTAKESVLYSFGATDTDGQLPSGYLTRAHNGDLFGATYGGGADDQGTIFRVTLSGTETLLYSFSGPESVPVYLTKKSKVLYGATYGGCGTIFRLLEDGTETVLFTLGGSNGCLPRGALAIDAANNIYGDTFTGTGNQGTVFRLAADGTYTVLHAFSGGADGANPYGGVLLDKSGNLYGTASDGGTWGQGVIFKVTKGGTFTVLYSFCAVKEQYCSDGKFPAAGVAMDGAGNLYGTTSDGGAYDNGIVYKLAPDGTETVLHSFSGGDGSFPQSDLLVKKSGVIYGVTPHGGVGGCGSAFRIGLDGAFRVLHHFKGGEDGCRSFSGMIQDDQNNLYGTTSGGGSYDHGTVFRIAR
jgi:uncharacterized repeat protein (TIGR03803 family)